MYFQKIPGKVPHQSLLKKLCCHGSRGNVLSQIKGWWKGRGQQQGSFPRAGHHWGPQIPKPSLPKTELTKGTNSEKLPDKVFSGYQLFSGKTIFSRELENHLWRYAGSSCDTERQINSYTDTHSTMHTGKTAQVWTEIGSELFIAEKETSNCEKLVWWKRQPTSQSHPKENLVKTDRECTKCFRKYSLDTENCPTAWLPRSCRRGEGRGMTETCKIMPSAEKELTKEANSCSISLLLHEGGTAITKRQVLEKQKEVLLPRKCKSSGIVIIHMSSNIR